MALSELAKARNKAKRDGWDGRAIQTHADAVAVLKHGCRFEADRAVRVRRFFESLLRHSKGQWAGQPFTLLEWQWVDVIAPLYGWLRKDGTRRFRRAHIEVPKKNGKSTLAAGFSLYHLIADGEPGAEVYNAANDRNQAAIVFNEAREMVMASPLLMERIGRAGIIDSRKTIVDGKTRSRYQALSADVPTKEGLNISALVVDELHAQKNRELWNTLEHGGAARRQPLRIVITTAGVFDETAIGWEQHEYARQVLDGTLEDFAFFPYVRGTADKDDWANPKVWAKANPSWGVTIREDEMAEACRAAQASVAEQNNFRRYRLNQWVQQSSRAFDLAQWDANWPAGHAELTDEYVAGKNADGGLDLGSVSDLTALAWAFPCEDDTDAIDLIVRCWVPEAQLTNPKNRNRALYQQWIDEGYLLSTPGNTVDYGFIKAQVLSDAERFNVLGVNIDRLFQGQQVMTDLAEEGLEMFPFGQGFLSMGPAMREWLRLFTGGKIHHGGNPILRWAVDNAVVKTDPAGLMKPDKQQSRQKIDPLVAAVMAVDRYVRHDKDAGTSTYDTHGIVWLA